nr:type VII secretion protein EccE [Micromonospora nigra]
MRGGRRIRAGQVVVAQVAVALMLAASGRGPFAVAGAALLAVLLLPVAWCRFRGRWGYEWLRTALSYLTRRRTLPPGADPAALLGLVDAGAVVGSTELAGGAAAVLDDPAGLVAMLEIGDPNDLLGDTAHVLPAPAALLPGAGADGPPVRVQLLLCGFAAPTVAAGSGAAGTSYRQLTDGRLVGGERAVLAVRVLRADGWSDEALRRALAGTVRRIVRRLGTVPARPLGEQPALRLLGELAHHDGQPVRESWPAVRSGGLLQTTFRLRRWPDPRTEAGRQLVPRMLGLPATATTVSLCAGPAGGDPSAAPAGLVVRLSATTPAELATATRALRRLVDAAGGAVDRLDGAHLTGLAGTLPLALPGEPVPGRVALELPFGAAGLMVGANRHGGAVAVRLFRPENTRVMLVGGVRAAQLVALRAMALGAQVVVRTTRPRDWEPFVRGVGLPGTTIPLLPPGRPVAGPATPLCPLLLVDDVGPAAAETVADAPWRTTLLLRDELTPGDADALGRADLVVLQPLDRAEAAVAGAALGLGSSAEWLTRIRDGMVAVVNRRALRWALLSPTPIESQLIGHPSRH